MVALVKHKTLSVLTEAIQHLALLLLLVVVVVAMMLTALLVVLAAVEGLVAQMQEQVALEHQDKEIMAGLMEAHHLLSRLAVVEGLVR